MPAGSGCHHLDLVHCPSADRVGVGLHLPHGPHLCAAPPVRLHAVLLALPSARPHHRLHQHLLRLHQGTSSWSVRAHIKVLASHAISTQLLLLLLRMPNSVVHVMLMDSLKKDESFLSLEKMHWCDSQGAKKSFSADDWSDGKAAWIAFCVAAGLALLTAAIVLPILKRFVDKGYTMWGPVRHSPVCDFQTPVVRSCHHWHSSSCCYFLARKPDWRRHASKLTCTRSGAVHLAGFLGFCTGLATRATARGVIWYSCGVGGVQGGCC